MVGNFFSFYLKLYSTIVLVFHLQYLYFHSNFLIPFQHVIFLLIFSKPLQLAFKRFCLRKTPLKPRIYFRKLRFQRIFSFSIARSARSFFPPSPLPFTFLLFTMRARSARSFLIKLNRTSFFINMSLSKTSFPPKQLLELIVALSHIIFFSIHPARQPRNQPLSQAKFAFFCMN
jgi:hypothetical protein